MVKQAKPIERKETDKTELRELESIKPERVKIGTELKTYITKRFEREREKAEREIEKAEFKSFRSYICYVIVIIIGLCIAVPFIMWFFAWMISG